MIELGMDNLLEYVSNNSKVMVQFGAGWCGNCKITKPKFKRLSTENEDVTFIYVDAEKFSESRGLASVTNLPTFASFLDGELIKETQGNKEETIKEALNAITGN
jgi:thiol-disulfide isomerase/thioredoxin